MVTKGLCHFPFSIPSSPVFRLMCLHCMRLSNKYTINDTLTQTSREVEHTHTHARTLPQLDTHTRTQPLDLSSVLGLRPPYSPQRI